MRNSLWISLALFILVQGVACGDVLIVADEFPAMEVLAKRLTADERIRSQLADQAHLPSTLGHFSAVIVYIHKELREPAEHAFIDYARNGGRLVLLHHSISSGKRQNHDWFRFLGVELPEGTLEQGGYKWTEGVSVTYVNLAPGQDVTQQDVRYTSKIEYSRSGRAAELLPAFTLNETEVYLNHVLRGEHQLLLGLRYVDPKTGKVWDQATAGWSRATERGRIFYFMPGHSARDFADPTYSRILLNAITGRGEPGLSHGAATAR